MEKSVVLGIDIGGTNTIYGFITREGTIIFHDEIPTNGSKPISDLIGRISDNVKRFFSKKKLSEITLNFAGCRSFQGWRVVQAVGWRVGSSSEGSVVVQAVGNY